MEAPLTTPPRIEEFDLIVVDAYSLLFRAFHSFPLSLTSPTGEYTNAIYGFTRLLLRLMQQVKPEYLVVGTDMGGPTFRHVSYTEYKQNREEAPAELIPQIPLMKDILEALNIPTIGIQGFEADDIIGTLVTRFSQEHPEMKVGVFTGDRDMFQLITGNVYVLYPARDGSGEVGVIGRQGVYDKLQVWPEQIVDYKALCGDASDNIPGVKGIGPKTASSLLEKFSTLEGIYAGISTSDATEVKPAVLKKLTEEKDMAELSQKLARIDINVPLECDLDDARLSNYNKQKTLELFDQLGFESLKKVLPPDEFEAEIQASLF